MYMCICIYKVLHMYLYVCIYLYVYLYLCIYVYRGWAAVGEVECGDGRAWAGLGGEGVGGHNAAIKHRTNMFYNPYAKLQSVIARGGYVRFRQER